MARWFDANNSEYLAFDKTGPTDPVIYGYPFCMSCWFMTPEQSAGTNDWLMFRCRPTSRDNYFGIGLRVVSPLTYGSFVAEASTGATTWFVNSGVVPNWEQWYHIVGEFISADYRNIYIDGIRTTQARTVAPVFGKLIEIGRKGLPTPTDYLYGNVANATIFDGTGFATADAVRMYQDSAFFEHYGPRMSFFDPFIRDADLDWIAGRHAATVGGTPEVKPHPPLAYPLRRRRAAIPAAPVGKRPHCGRYWKTDREVVAA